uniref:beta-phosphoglucomutase n=1 Tax=Enterocloster clostridioformis TaxID=1531 RepID=UPI0025A4FAE4|nr:beta-phosphoglucomutase [Enterocloster clostridioformis]
MSHEALIFDLDGVLVDTAKYHYLAWKQLADELGIPFSERDNERFKGVSRARCMEILLEIGGRTMSPEEQAAYADQKNGIYIDYIKKMDKSEILPGVTEFLTDARKKSYQIALGSASKNTALILERLELTPYFDAVVDGTKVTQAKPDPQVFLQGAAELGLSPANCIVFEDAVAGIQAARAGGMTAVGIGSRDTLYEADLILPGFADITITEVEQWLSATQK